MTNAPDTVVRPRTNEDLAPAAAALVRVHHLDGYPVEGVSDPIAWLTPDGLVEAWVAELDGRVVGHAALVTATDSDDAARLWSAHSGTPVSEILVLARLFVDPDARGHKLGEDLTRAIMNAAARRGRPLVLDVMTKDTAAIRLYERLGWRRIGTVTHTFGDGHETPAVCYVAPGLAK